MLNAEIYLCVCVWMLYRCIWPLYVRICNVQYSEVHISVATMKAMTVDQIVFSTGAFYVIVFFFVCVWCFMVWINGANNPWLSIKLHFSYRKHSNSIICVCSLTPVSHSYLNFWSGSIQKQFYQLEDVHIASYNLIRFFVFSILPFSFRILIVIVFGHRLTKIKAKCK